MKQYLHKIIHYFSQWENRQKLCRRIVKLCGYCTLGTFGVALIAGLLFLYCVLV